MHDDKEGNAQDMVIAHTGTRPWAIEVGLCYKREENIVFHARRISLRFKKQSDNEP